MIRRSSETGTGFSSAGSQILLAVAVMAVSAVIVAVAGRSGLERAMLVPIVLVVGTAGLFILLQRPQITLALLIVAGILVTREIGTGTQSGLNGALLGTVVAIPIWLLRLLFRSEGERPVRSLSIIPLYCFMAVAVLALLVGQFPWFPAPHASYSAQLGQLAVFLCSGGIFLVAASQLQDMRWLKGITYLFLFVGSFHLLARLLGESSVNLGSYLPEAVTMGSMFWAWLVALSFGQALVNKDLNPVGRLAMLAVTVTALYIGLTGLRTWVSGWFPAVLAMGVIVFLRFPLQTLLSAPAVGVVGLVGWQLLKGLATAGDNVYSYETRLAAMQSLFPLLVRDPVLGLGPANYYHYTPLFPILGWYVKFNSHNNYLDIIAQTGLLGLICFIWFAVAVGLTGWRLRTRPMGGFERAYVYSVVGGAVASFVAAGIGDWLLPFIYNTGFPGFRTSVLPWLFMGGMVALEQHLNRRA